MIKLETRTEKDRMNHIQEIASSQENYWAHISECIPDKATYNPYDLNLPNLDTHSYVVDWQLAMEATLDADKLWYSDINNNK